MAIASDTGGNDTLVETNGHDMLLTDDYFIVGTILDPVNTSGQLEDSDYYDRFLSGPTLLVEELGGIFENAELDGVDDAAGNTIVIGDQSGKAYIGTGSSAAFTPIDQLDVRYRSDSVVVAAYGSRT